MDYSKLKLEDFLINQEFIKWVTTPKEDREIFWQKWMENHPEQRDAIYEARKIIRNLEFQAIESADGDDEVILDLILSGRYSASRQVSKNKVSAQKILFNALKVAASLLVVVGLTFVFLQYLKPKAPTVQVAEDVIVKSAKNGQKLTVILPDSSVVKLNSESHLSYPGHFGEVRKVELVGEAFFEVTKRGGRSFIVETPHLTTTVLGTSFNIRAYNSEVESVSLVSGKVSIQNKKEKDRPPVILSPREKIEYNASSNSLAFMPFYSDEVLWKDGIILFKDTDLASFISTVERWFGVNITVLGNERNDWLINGRFENESLELILESLKFTEDISYAIHGKEVVLII